ncbi:MAG: hypothetical protein JWO60_416 [Frankiales bacterium]|nr:hypothetical protein [Frankiales bacterium]
MSGLRDLDDRVVPRAAARLRAAVESVRGRRRARGTPARVEAAPPARPGALRRLDERYARRGPLGLVRDVPQVGLVVVAAVFLVGAGVALARNDDDGASRGTAAQVREESRVLGPAPGASVPDYVADAAAGAAKASQDRPEVLHVALVSLAEYRRPQDVRDLLTGLEVQRAYLKVPSSDPSEVLSADVEDLVGDLQQLYAATAERKAEDQEEFLKLARSIDPGNEEQRRFKEFYELSARLAGREATAYRTGCTCLFSVVVRGPAGTLAALPALPGVRAVELAPGGVALSELRVRPLGPEQTTTVSVGPEPSPQPSR